MQLKMFKLSSVLLASLFVTHFTPNVVARPAKSGSGIITLPLRRVHTVRNDLHPQILLQHHINRGQSRLARMTGRAGPSLTELTNAVHKRMVLINGRQGSRKVRRNGYRIGSSSKSSGVSAASASDTVNNSTGGSSGSTAAIQPTANSSLGLDIIGNDVGYFATLQIGTPPQDFRILMDSGSADFWVGSATCQSVNGGGCGNHVFLGAQESSSFVDTQQSWQIQYGTGAVAGNIVTDSVNIAGLALDNHTFGIAEIETTDFSDNSVPFDGLMGLAQSTLSEQKTLTPVESLAKSGLIAEAITSFKISRLADNKNDGEITFGGLDASKFDATTLVTVDNVSPRGFWEASMTAVSVDGTDTGLQNRTAILDTGTTTIIAPSSDAASVHKLISGAQGDGQGGFTVPCTTNATVALTFGGNSFEIDSRDLVLKPVNSNNPTGDCVSGISAGNIGGATEWLVGDVFLKNAYFSTDIGKNQISLAKLV